MIQLSKKAEAQVDALLRHYDRPNRPEAVVNLRSVLAQTPAEIEIRSGECLHAPRPYPELARPGRWWLKIGRYWIAYVSTTPPMVIGVFYDTANIPKRL